MIDLLGCRRPECGKVGREKKETEDLEDAGEDWDVNQIFQVEMFEAAALDLGAEGKGLGWICKYDSHLCIDYIWYDEAA